ncbi:hypothetical protein PG985_012960 [Apiospora marii]|uniref:uncharacterized protein n=1 Tax=Apiospora marii TaxID=335849 RepID=UPI003130D9E1
MEGYRKISQLMACQDECAIYRRFRNLNSLNLLYLQAELTHLEQDLQRLTERDARSLERRFYAKDWLSLSQNDDEDEDAEQWDKFLEIRGKLEKYNDALLKQAEIARLGAPAAYDLKFLRGWWRRPRMGSFPLVGLDRFSYTEKYERDLVALKTRCHAAFAFFPHPLRSENDAFHCDDLSANCVPGVEQQDQTELGIGEGIYEYNDAWITMVIRVIVTVVASLLPTVSVVIQYFIQSDLVKLYLIVVASAIFALALAVMTNARMVEVFAATSAYVTSDL